MEPSTDTLRKLAPCWTLAGDEQLLTLLQNTHKRLVEKCHEANNQLEKMASALDDASISIQNVNNQFMALSSSQFIESRVYDDDADVTSDTPVVKESVPAQSPESELASLKKSLAIVESSHEIITILHDSDTESDSDDDTPARMVLKQRDVYADRPLPYIIGSQPWKNKWHAGLIVEDSDSDSSASKVGGDSDQYSQSEPEDLQPDTLHVPDTLDRTISETSSELPSEQEVVSKPTPSELANEIARRLGAGPPPKMVEPEPEYTAPVKPAARKVYRPQEPVASTIFPDEPPPLDSEDDIFASLHTSEPYRQQEISSDEGDIFKDLQPVASAKPVSIFDAGPTPHMFDKKYSPDQQRTVNTTIPTQQEEPAGPIEDRGVKKPVGGISLFGNKGTESIGAAILKRNQRKSTSSEESENDIPEPTRPNQQVKKEKDIFDDLFARNQPPKSKSQNINIINDMKTVIQKKTETKNEKHISKVSKVDLFSDNLFDDIDDIFTTKAPTDKKENTKATKSIFDDDDDLFSEVAAPKTVKTEVKTSAKKGLFDSDDELFSEIKPREQKVESVKAQVSKITANEITKVTPSHIVNEVKNSKTTESSIFDDDEDDILSDLQNTSKMLNTRSTEKSKKANEILKVEQSNVSKSTSLFDEDHDDSDIFAQVKPSIKHVEPVETKPDIAEKVERKVNKTLKTDNIVDHIPKDNESNEPNNNKDITEKIDNEVIHNFNNKNYSLSEEHMNTLSSVLLTKSIKESNSIFNSNTSEKEVENISDIIKNTETKVANSIFDSETEKQSDDEFSEQDFDDLPPKVNTIRDHSNTKQTETITNKPNIFDNIPIEENIFTSNTVKQDNFVTTQPEPIGTKSEEDNNIDIKTNSSINEVHIFADILEPPIFEKPKEPKKSKNVNALFDDDSDDESLFFKKNDVISDEKPEYFSTPQDKRFGIFADEPPDFSKMADDFDDNLFSSMAKPKTPENLNKTKVELTKNSAVSNETTDVNEKIFSTLKNEESISNIPTMTGTNDGLSKVSSTDELHESTKTRDCNASREENLYKLPENKTTLSKNNGNLYEENLFKTNPETLDRESKLSDDELFSSAPKAFSVQKTDAFVKTKTESTKNTDDNLFTAAPKQNEPVPKKDKEPKTKIDAQFENSANSSNISDDELFSSKPEKDLPIPNKKHESKSSDEDLFKKPSSPSNRNEEHKNGSELSKSPDLDTKEPKKVGKLKTIGLNINVNALLPGASPKKIKKDQLDGQTQSLATQSPENESPRNITESPVNISPEDETLRATTKSPEVVKAVSFEHEKNAGVLDNKLSKERAKIQVKRRPSTRRARKEAVRKSGIDFGEDSTDNSSSIDDSPRTQNKDKSRPINDGKKIQSNTQTDDVIQVLSDPGNNLPKEITNRKNTVENVDNLPEYMPKTETEPAESIQHTEKTAEFQARQVENIPTVSSTRDVKSKVVYILNDEDIFNTNIEKSSDFSSKSENINPIGISTLGNAYSTKTEENTKGTVEDDKITKKYIKNNIFGDNGDDDEIFKGKSQNKSIFDSDSEEELFGKSKKVLKGVEKETKEVKRQIKGSLFGDEDDDDDLFAVKTKKNVEPVAQTSKPSIKEVPKSTEPVFEDPLSMFSDD